MICQRLGELPKSPPGTSVDGLNAIYLGPANLPLVGSAFVSETRLMATKWRIAGEEIGSCNCSWGCPCQFNALPTHGRCEAALAWEIREGYYGDTRLEGVRFARVYCWPGAIHEGNGTRLMIIDETATPGQRAALLALESGTQGGLYFEIFAAVCPNVLEPI